MQRAHKKLFMLVAIAFVLLLFTLASAFYSLDNDIKWSKDELTILSSLRLTPAGTTVPQSALSLFGQQLFFEQGLSLNHDVSCASCHQPDKFFTDGKKVATAGIKSTERSTPTIVGSSDANFLFWDGRKDSLWSQALGPLEAAAEHGGTRLQYARFISQHYRESYVALFNKNIDLLNFSLLPQQAAPGNNIEYNRAWFTISVEERILINEIFINIGKSIASYEQDIALKPSRFDRYVDKLLNENSHALADTDILSKSEIAGLKLFISEKSQCIRCHNGPLFTNHDFQTTLVPNPSNDQGRATGINLLLTDEFNCFNQRSSKDKHCRHLRFTKKSGLELEKAFKVPTLRNIEKTAPYMHKGQFAQLSEVLRHYNVAYQDKAHSEINPLNLFPHELKQIEDFLLTLTSDFENDKHWFVAQTQD